MSFILGYCSPLIMAAIFGRNRVSDDDAAAAAPSRGHSITTMARQLRTMIQLFFDAYQLAPRRRGDGGANIKNHCW
jgi:hypothetical protein